MRILIASQYYRPAYDLGGTVTRTVALAEGLARLNHQVTVVTSSAIGLKERASRHSQVTTTAGVTVHHLGSWARLNKVQLCPSVAGWAKSHVRCFDTVGIVGLYDLFGPAVARQARRSGVAYFVVPCGMVCEHNNRPWHKRVYHFAVGRRLLRNARAIISTSRTEKAELVQFGLREDRLVQVPNGVWLSDFERLPPRGKFREKLQISERESMILWLGRIDPIKNLEQLLAAVVDLRGIAWRLVIAGPCESAGYADSLRKRVQELGLGQRVHLHSPCYGDEKLSAFVDADVLALVSNYESWGNVAVEAMASGLPVLVTNTCGVAEMVVEGGGLIVRKDAAAIRDGLRRLLSDTNLLAEIKARLPSLVRQYSWERSVEQLAALFQGWGRAPLK
jgi:glycosyltransferase involved in cell wall biosynthesis